MGVKVKHIDVSGALRKTDRMKKAAVSAYTLAARRDSAPYVPRLSGALRSSAEAQTSATTGKLVYGGSGVKYASKQYYASGFRYTTPGTGSKWFEKAKRSNGSKWAKEAATAAGKVARGK